MTPNFFQAPTLKKSKWKLPYKNLGRFYFTGYPSSDFSNSKYYTVLCSVLLTAVIALIILYQDDDKSCQISRQQSSINTQYGCYSTIISSVKMEFVSKITIFGLKIMVKKKSNPALPEVCYFCY